MKKEFGLNYASITDVNFTAKYRANCHCNAVQYEVCSDPVDAKICHSLFNFGGESKLPVKFKPTCHIFYAMRVIDIIDDLPKWSGHKNHSELIGN